MIARRALAVALAAGSVAAGALPATAAAPVHKKAKVFDYDITPHKIVVPPRSTVSWKWPSADEAGDQHDVYLKTKPKGVKRFQSEITSSDYTYKHKFTKKGKYLVICKLHPFDMRQTIIVR